MYAVYVSRRRLMQKTGKPQRRTPPLFKVSEASRVVVREAACVERLAYTRTQAAEALGISRSTLNRRVLPLIDTVAMPWGTRLIPVDELQRLLAEQRRPARAQALSGMMPGRPVAVAIDVVDRIRAEHAAGSSLGKIARELTADQIPRARGGAQWWPSTVRAVLRRSAA
jgi:Recombinase/Bacterial regulatory protein, Fis family